VNEPRRRFTLLPTRRGDPRASVVAFVLQLVLIFIVAPSLIVPIAFEMLRDSTGREVMPERISFITAVPENTTATPERPRAGGDGREASPTPSEPAPPISAPTEAPSGVPSAPAKGTQPAGGIGPLVGGGGPTQGVRPSFNDPRLWFSPSGEIEAPIQPMTRADSLQLILNATAEAFVDSMNRATPSGGRAPGDWTFERNGKKYGIDPQYIRLGNFSLPTAVLALLPMNAQANPMATERARRLSSMRSEIIEQADRRQRDDDFYAAVRALRARKERERKEKAAAQPPVAAPNPTSGSGRP